MLWLPSAFFLARLGQTLELQMPDELKRQGAQLWGSETALLESINTASINYAGLNLHLCANKADVTLKRLNGEVQNSRGTDPYRLLDIGKHAQGLILDFGANIGDFTTAAALTRPNAQVVAIEPVPQNVWFIRYNLFLNNVTEMPCHLVGSSTARGVCILNRAVVHHRIGLAYNSDVDIAFNMADTQLASIANPSFSQGSTTKVRAVSARDFLIPGVRVLLLKVDCEGCEYDLVPSLGEAFFNRTLIERFAAEIHLSLDSRRKRRNRPTAARQRNAAEAESLFHSLHRRGCGKIKSILVC